VIHPATEMRRLAGQFALFLAFCYFLLPFGAVVLAFNDDPLPAYRWLLILLPAPVFVPSVVAAVRLQRTSDVEQMKRLWPRSLLLAIAGMALFVGEAILMNQTKAV
jgi:hypothetical protein